MKIPRRKGLIKEIVEWIVISLSAIASTVVLATYAYPRIEYIPPLNILISGLVVVIIGLMIYIVFLLRKAKVKIKYGRDDLISTGQALIRGIKSRAILISGDMSWTDSYISPINEAARNGKKIVIFYFDNGSSKVKDNHDRLLKAGAYLVGLKIDPLVRATIIDPDDPDDSILFLVKRTLIKEPKITGQGEPGSDENYTYVTSIRRRNKDPWLFDTVIAFYHFLESYNQISFRGS